MRALIVGECDTCGSKDRVLHPTIAYGIETCACNKCFGRGLADDADDADDLRDEIERTEKRLRTLQRALASIEGRRSFS